MGVMSAFISLGESMLCILHLRVLTVVLPQDVGKYSVGSERHQRRMILFAEQHLQSFSDIRFCCFAFTHFEKGIFVFSLPLNNTCPFTFEVSSEDSPRSNIERNHGFA